MFIAALFFTLSASAKTADGKSYSADNELTDGIYNIIDTKTGLYLDVYASDASSDNRVFLAKQSGLPTQSFSVKRQDDGSYVFFPQSEGGICSLAYHADVMESNAVTKQVQQSDTGKFTVTPHVTPNGNVQYSINPTSLNDDMLFLGISAESNANGQLLAGLVVDNQVSPQRWKFVKPTAESLQLNGGYLNVRVGYTDVIYHSVTPSYLDSNIEWKSSDPGVVVVGSNGKIYGVSEGTAVITATCGQKTVSITVKASPYVAYTWYSQHNPYTGGWWGESLRDIYFTTWGGTRKRFMVSGFANNYDWMDQGCKVCTEAMVLHNMGALLTEGYDFRYNKYNALKADPYTVALANAGTDGVNYKNMYVPNNPILIIHSMINPRFNVGGKAVTTREYYGGNLRHIKELLEQHPEGVVVGMNDFARNNSHWVVFTECLNPDDPYGNYEFRICDPASETPERGDNVPFKQSTSYLNLGYGYWSITSYSVYEIVG